MIDVALLGRIVVVLILTLTVAMTIGMAYEFWRGNE
jgi:hypothetical protein